MVCKKKNHSIKVFKLTSIYGNTKDTRRAAKKEGILLIHILVQEM